MSNSPVDRAAHVMTRTDDEKTVEVDAAFDRRAAGWVRSFFDGADPALGREVRLRFHRPADFADPLPERFPPRWLYARRKSDGLVLHVCTELMNACPPQALQASVDVELALYSLDRARKAFGFNFQRRIQPSLGLSGSAVNLVRQMVWHLEKALQLQAATALIIERGRGRAQVFYLFHILAHLPEEAHHYRHMQQRNWVRGIYLGQKAEHYLPLSLLQQAGMSPELISFWDRCHPFLLAADRRVLEQLARRSADDADLQFADRVVALFDILRNHLSF